MPCESQVKSWQCSRRWQSTLEGISHVTLGESSNPSFLNGLNMCRCGQAVGARTPSWSVGHFHQPIHPHMPFPTVTLNDGNQVSSFFKFVTSESTYRNTSATDNSLRNRHISLWERRQWVRRTGHRVRILPYRRLSKSVCPLSASSFGAQVYTTKLIRTKRASVKVSESLD